MKIRFAGLGLIACGLLFAVLFVYLPIRDGAAGVMGPVRLQALVFIPLAVVTAGVPDCWLPGVGGVPGATQVERSNCPGPSDHHRLGNPHRARVLANQDPVVAPTGTGASRRVAESADVARRPMIAAASQRPRSWILWVAAAVALAYLLLPRPYPGDVALKTSMCVLLAIAAFRGKLNLFALALLFSAAGDAFLAYDGKRLFVPGLTSFLVTHVLYAIVFVLATKAAAAPMTTGRKVMLAVIPSFAVAYSVVLWPKLGALAIPVVLYIAAIVVMAMLSLRVRAIEVPLGAVLFMVSDSLISLEKFLWQAAWIGPLVWSTYALAQLLITRGMLMNPRKVTAEPTAL